MRKTGKILLLILPGLFILYTLVGFLVVPWAITTKVPLRLSEQLSRPVAIQEAGFNPFLFTLQINGFDVQESDGSPLLGFGELFINFDPAASLVNRAYTFAEIRVELPYGLAWVRADGSLNLAALGSSSKSDDVPPEALPEENSSPESAELPAILIEQLSIQQGMLEFRDYSRPTPFVAHFVPINLTLEQFSTQRGQANSYALSAERGAGEKITWEGTVTLEPFQSEGRLVFEDYQLPRLWTYAQDLVRFEIPQGQMTMKGHYRLSTTNQGVDVLVDGGSLTIHDLQIQEKGTLSPVITIPLFEVNGVSVDVGKQDVRIPSIKSRDAHFAGWVGKDGVVNYQTLFSPVVLENQTVPEQEPSSANPWNMIIGDLALDNFTIDFEDRQPEDPVKLLLDTIHFHTSDVSLDLDRPLPLDLAFQFNQTGEAKLQGTLEIDPLTIDLDVSLSDIALQPFQPYMASFVQFDVGDGALTLQGKTQYQTGAKTQPMVTFLGGIGVSNLAFDDPMQTNPFLSWDALELKELDLQIEPTSVTLQEVELTNPELVLLIDADGGMNLKRLFSPPGSVSQEETTADENPSEAETPAEPPTPVKIGAVTLTNLLARFTDQSISPNVVTNIEGLTGTIKGLSSDQLAKADVALQGTVDKYAPFKIAGQINPLSEDAYTDLTVTFKNLDLPTVSPYSAHYVGYPITKGKLSLDLECKVSEKTLVGENKVLIDQLTMGAKIESPDATSLPIPLALALLKDRKGQIDIDLPVRGNLDDPDFSYGGVIWNALGNLLTKVATSPFAMVGSLVGGSGDDLQYVAFPPGIARLSPSEQEKLNALGQALGDRPALRLDIVGAADPQVDRQGLASAQLGKQLQKRKFVEGSSSATTEMSLEQIELSPEEEVRLLTEVYGEQFGAQPDTLPSSSEGKARDIPSTDQMRAKLIESMKVEDEQLRLLAQQRAQGIREFLLQEGKVSGDRVFLLEPNLSPVTEEQTVRSPLALAAN
ncbi:MAG: ATPase [Nitrospirales bacterium]|nr:MAG: ATPase [Nitrospirales bacterium]